MGKRGSVEERDSEGMSRRTLGRRICRGGSSVRKWAQQGVS